MELLQCQLSLPVVHLLVHLGVDGTLREMFVMEILQDRSGHPWQRLPEQLLVPHPGPAPPGRLVKDGEAVVLEVVSLDVDHDGALSLLFVLLSQS